jgi:hypothetical protein
MSITLRNRPSLEFRFPTEIVGADVQLEVLQHLGLPILLDELAPQLAAALDSNFATTVRP